MTITHITERELALERENERLLNTIRVQAAAVEAQKECIAELDAQPVQEPVAWMYQCTADKSGPVLLQKKKNWAESGTGLWIETPLYAAPVQPAPTAGAYAHAFSDGWQAAVAAPQPEPTIKESFTVAEQSRELDAGMAAQHYCRGLWGAARGHSDWRKVHEHFSNGYKQGVYDNEMAQGPYPWPDDPLDLELRGLLASKLQCWHRLDQAESTELVALFESLRPQPEAQPVKQDQTVRPNIPDLLAEWERRSKDALPADAMLINKHIRELREAIEGAKP